MILRREVQYPGRDKSAVEVRTSEFNLPRLAARNVIVVHVGKAVLKTECEALPHNPYSIDGVDKGLCLGLKQFAY